jgi:AraC family transcriptional regulator
MSYQRQTIFQTPLLTWQRVVLDESRDTWSPEYHVESARLLMPLMWCFDCRLTSLSRPFVCDATSALWLSPESGYRMRRPWCKQSSEMFVVDVALGPARRVAIPLDAHVRLRAWRAAQSNGTVDALELEENVSAFISGVLSVDCVKTPSPHRAVERAREYLAVAPHRNDSLGEIAAAVHCSPFHLARTFRQHTGQSLHRYRTALRMTQALDRLQQGQVNLSALASDLGYSGHSHFTSVFKRMIGVVPDQMRTNLIFARAPK